MEKRIERYESCLREQELAVSTIKIYIRYAREIEQHIEMAGASKQSILDYKQELRERKVAPATSNLAIIAINRYLKFAGYQDFTVKTEKIQKRRSLENVISIEEYQKMLQLTKTGRRRKYYYILRTLA